MNIVINTSPIIFLAKINCLHLKEWLWTRLGQCLAELVAAQKINQADKRAVYGIVTDGNLWQFGYLKADLFTKNEENYTLDNIQRLYGALEYLACLVEQAN